MPPVSEPMGGQCWRDVQMLKEKAEVTERLLFANDETIQHLSNAVLDLGKQVIELRKRVSSTEGQNWQRGCRG